MPSALRSILQRDGFRGLFSGALVTVVRDAPFSSIYLVCYTRLKDSVQKMTPSTPVLISNMIAGLAAGTVASIVTHPPDVVKTRLQVAPLRMSSAAAVAEILSVGVNCILYLDAN